MPILVYYSGVSSFSQRITAETSCDLDMSNFPFDQHVCSIEFYVNKWDAHVISTFDKTDLDFYQPSGSWDVVDTVIEVENKNILIHITLARKPAFILVNLMLPMTLLTFLSPLVFLLPNNSGERVGFSITVLLAISVFMTMVADQIPQKSQPLPLALTMLFVSYSLTVVVVIIVIINARIYRIPDRVPVPRILKCILTVTKCVCYCFRRRNTRNEDMDGENEEDLSLNGKDQHSKNIKAIKIVTWKDASWAIDMLAMIVIYFLKILVVILCFTALKSKETLDHESQ